MITLKRNLKEGKKMKVKNISPQTKKTIIKASIFAACAIIALSLTYWALIVFWLNDIVNIPYISYRYTLQNQDREVIITDIDEVNAPDDFVIPASIDGYPVTTIANEAFMNFTRLRKVTLPDTITTIGDRAFYGCTNLSEIVPSQNINEIGEDAFLGTYYIEHSSDEDGWVYLGQVIIAYTGTFPSNTVLVTSEDTKTEFDPTVYNVVDITFGNVTGVTNSLFAGQEGVVFAEIPETITEIPSTLFEDCVNLTEVRFHDNVHSIGANAFDGCTSLTLDSSDLPNALTSIGAYAFANTNITGAFSFPTSLVTLGEGVFQNCVNLTSFSISTDASLANISSFMFDGCTSLETVNLPRDLTSIGQYAFRSTAIREILIPQGITSIQTGVFEDCSNLEKVVAYDVGLRSIGQYAFRNCSNLRTFQVLDANGEVLPGSYEGMIMLPSSLTTFTAVGSDGYIFGSDNVEDAPKFSSIVIPSGVTEIQGYQFYNNTNLKHIEFELETYYSDIDAEGNPVGTVTYSSSLEIIGPSAFENCTSLEEIVMPDSVFNFNSAGFRNASSLRSITLPNNSRFSAIPVSLFDGCVSLEAIDIPSSVGVIRNRSFAQCISLDYVVLPEDLRQVEALAFTEMSEDFVIYSLTEKPNYNRIWVENWKDESIPVYWAGEWEYDEYGVPTPIVNA